MMHRITNFDLEHKLGDCSICGPSVRLKVEVRASGKITRRCRRPKVRSDGTVITPIKVTAEELEDAAARQGGRCAVCQVEAPLVLDHDHVTGQFRGLLCRNCNLALGFLKDNPDTAVAAADYLRNACGGHAVGMR